MRQQGAYFARGIRPGRYNGLHARKNTGRSNFSIVIGSLSGRCRSQCDGRHEKPEERFSGHRFLSSIVIPWTRAGGDRRRPHERHRPAPPEAVPEEPRHARPARADDHAQSARIEDLSKLQSLAAGGIKPPCRHQTLLSIQLVRTPMKVWSRASPCSCPS